jgi:hypothetical protein
MILAAMIVCIGLQQALPAQLVPVSQQELFLAQTFYELDDYSRAEQHEFRIERTFAIENGKPFLTEKRWLAGWMIGDIRLDDPIKPAPIISKWELSASGGHKTETIKDFQVDEFRLDRLRCFLPPSANIAPKSSWQVDAEGNASIHLPKVRYRFKLEKSEVAGESVRFWIDATASELETSDALQVSANLIILVKGSEYSLESGAWTTPRASMIGGESDKFKLVQTLKAIAPKSAANKV